MVREMLLHRQDTYRGNAWQPWTQNLYTYVGNNPVNYVDPTGHSRSCAYGERVHCAVEDYFIKTFGPLADTEAYIPGVGFADMVLRAPDLPTQIWELKSIAYSPVGDLLLNEKGQTQLAGYVDGANAVPGFTWNPNGTVLAHPDDPGQEIVLVTYPSDPGMVYYYERKKTPQEEPVTVKVPDQVIIYELLMMGALLEALGDRSSGAGGSAGGVLAY